MQLKMSCLSTLYEEDQAEKKRLVRQLRKEAIEVNLMSSTPRPLPSSVKVAVPKGENGQI